MAVNLVEKDLCGLRIVMALYLLRRDLFPPGGELNVKENIAVNNAGGRRCWNRREDGG